MKSSGKKERGLVEPSKKIRIGWQEWVSLPSIGVPMVKAKIDTGAKTSSLHAMDIRRYKKNQKDYVSFKVHPLQGTKKIAVVCHAPIIDYRAVMSSNAQLEKRYVISSIIILGGKSWEIEITLSNRDPLRFRMLLGRQALNSRVLIDPAKRLLTQSISPKAAKAIYLER